MDELVISDFTAEDAAELYKIECTCFTDNWSMSQFEGIKDCDYAHFFTARKSGGTVGFAGVYCLDVCELMNIAVLPEYRQNGIAQKLLERCFECARENECDSMLLEVRKSNLPAISLYEKNGFIKIGTRKKYYSAPVEDADIMQKEICK